MMAMMKRIGMMIAMLALGISVVLGVFTVSGNYFASKTYINKIERINGDVVYADAGNIAITFTSPIISTTGDTTVASFIVSANGTRLQLKSILVPEKAASNATSTLVFPISDIAPLLGLETYAVEIYVKNSKYGGEFISLPLIPLDFNKFFSVEPEGDKV